MHRPVLILLALGAPSLAAAATLDVCTSGCTYSSLGAAYTASLDGDTITLGSGTWTQSLEPAHDLTIVGSGEGVTTWAGQAAINETLKIDAGVSVTVTDLTLQVAKRRAVKVAGDFVAQRVTFEGVRLNRQGLAVKMTAGTALLDDCTVTGHDAAAKDGAALWCKDATLDLVDTTVTGTSSHRGAVGFENCDASITGSAITSNGAAEFGGGLYIIAGSTVDVRAGTTLSGNQAPDGGGVYVKDSSLSIDAATVSSNSASNNGGGLYADHSEVSMSASAISGNSATSEGGGYFGTSATFASDNTTWSGNSAGDWGGALSTYYGSISQTDDRVEENQATGSSAGGGAVSTEGTTYTALRTNFERNGARGDGGSLNLQGDADVSVTQCDFADNWADDDGGAVFLLDISSGYTVIVDGSAFRGNSATDIGGGMYSASLDSLTVLDSDFVDNTARRSGAWGSFSSREISSTRVFHCLNDASDSGGAVVLDDVEGATLHNDVFVENTADDYGGGLYLDSSTATIRNHTYLGNGSTYGGGLYLDNATLDLRNTLIAGTADGHGVYLRSSTLDKDYNDWFDNTPDHIGSLMVATALGAHSITSDPLLQAYTNDGDCANDTLWPRIDSPLVDAGDPSLTDPDGSRSDIGAYGGPDADPDAWIDADRDGFPVMWDCDDSDPDAYPNAPEYCNDVDDDCDGDVDEGAVDPSTWYADSDRDGWGAGAGVLQCDPPARDWVTQTGDCDPSDSLINPGADEVCDGVDNDCDASVDEPDALDAGTWYADSDTDGFGDASVPQTACDQPTGYVADATDCDDGAVGVNPGATEVCDGVDQDCDELIDDNATDAVTWYLDADGDDYGLTASTTDACTEPAGYAADPGDCDDTAVGVFPGATEVCDGVDQDCDGAVDDSAVDAPTWYYDGDGDGYGVDTTTATQCEAPAGYAADAGDCDDATGSTYPGATEICDGADNDCDGEIDEGVELLTWYADGDGDGYGDLLVTQSSCSQPPGYVLDATDCDDGSASVGGPTDWYADGDGDGYGDGSPTSACTAPAGSVALDGDCDDGVSTVNPGADEYCNGVDDDCDGSTDEASAVDASTWYVDGDGDGYGSATTATVACSAPAGFVADATDCDDTSTVVHPGADETCDALDRNCDGDAEAGAVDASTWYTDRDGDSWGDLAAPVDACTQPAGTVVDATDCDDTRTDVYPGADEYCDAVDHDCDGVAVEDDAVDSLTWYADVDGDGYGDDGVTALACAQPDNYADVAGDCDDTTAAVSPDATEVCNSVDDDCDEIVDEDDAADASTWYVDGDGDGYGSSSTVVACDRPAGTVATGSDCDDSRDDVWPGAPELCDGVDTDCSGVLDDDYASDASTWYGDGDGDGYGDAADAHVSCTAPAGHVADATDCDDSSAAVSPAATEVCNGVDDDCDAVIDEDDAADASTWYTDSDGDGYGDATLSTVSCDAPAGTVADATDCDDTSDLTWPGAPELCDGVDNDCNTVVDDGTVSVDWYADTDGDGLGDPLVSTSNCLQPSGYVANPDDCDDSSSAVGAATAWYADTDGDGFGDAGSVTYSCTLPAGYVADDSDCDDALVGVHPGADETCDSVDEDCDGVVDEDVVGAPVWYQDDDGDGYGDPSVTDEACTAPDGFVADANDCDDTDEDVSPVADELCNGEDDDCDGEIDEDDSVDAPVWYQDDDGDGYGLDAVTAVQCEAPAGYVPDGGDCDDGTAVINPAVSEVCNGVDDNCDGSTDGPEALGVVTWYLDGDGDGYGSDLSSITTCDRPTGYVPRGGDCDDGTVDVSPAQEELCDGVDQDCNGLIDDAAADAPLWWPDVDGDGFGDVSGAVYACEPPDGYVGPSGDCDPTEDLTYPGAAELCDGADNDCDGTVDDGVTDVTWYADADGDGYGDAAVTQVSCSPQDGYVLDGTDCDDTDSDVGGPVEWLTDADGDGYGTDGTGVLACTAPAGTSAEGGDCDDSDATVSPGADEVCGGGDEDCDGVVDADATDMVEWGYDADGDGFGVDWWTVMGCAAPDGFGTVGDCDDDDAAINPEAPEQCDAIDHDCDGDPMAGSVYTDWYLDSDGDGWGDDGVTRSDCVQPEGYVADAGDCDDTSDAISPDAEEVWYDGVDQDCDGGSDYDADADGFDSSDYEGGTDCDDTDAAVNLDAEEVWYDGVDQDCDGGSDYDADGDGFDSDEHGGDDCVDSDPAINPDAEEIPGNRVDEDCDGDLGDAPGDSGLPVDTAGTQDPGVGCTCDSGGGLGGAWLLGLLLPLGLRRRR